MPATGSMEQLEVVVSGKLQEMDKEPVNVQVIVFQSEGHMSKLQLMYEGEVLIEADPYQPEVHGTDASEGDSSLEDREDIEGMGEDGELTEIAKLREELERVVSSKDEQIASLESELEAARERLSMLDSASATEKGKMDVWRMNCEQLARMMRSLRPRMLRLQSYMPAYQHYLPLDPLTPQLVPLCLLPLQLPPLSENV